MNIKYITLEEISKNYPEIYIRISSLKEAQKYEYVINLDTKKIYIPTPTGFVFEVLPEGNTSSLIGTFDIKLLDAIVKELKSVVNKNPRLLDLIQSITMFTGVG